MTTATRTQEEILNDAGDALALAKRALDELLGGQGPQRAAGIRNIAVWGRITTATLKNLATRAGSEEFQRWYEPWHIELTGDEGFTYLYDLRNQIEKEGALGALGSSIYIDYMNTDDIAKLPAPPHATSFFVGDRWGGSGWMVELPDGTTETHYATLPDEIKVTSELRFAEPTTNRKRVPPAESVESLSRRYLAFLRAMVDAARKHFVK